MKNSLQLAEPPKFLISITLLFWGYQSELLIWAILMAFILEIKLWITWRLHLDDYGFYKVGNFCTLLFIVSILIVVFGSKPQLMIHQLVNLSPIVFYPLLLSEYYSNSGTIPLGAFIYRYRKNDSQTRIKLGYFFFAISLLATSVINSHPDRFFVMVIFIFFWALWHIKSSSVSIVKWLGIFTLVISISYFGQQSLVRTALSFEHWATEYFSDFFSGERDPFRSKTAMGRIGELKLSNKIVMRVKIKNTKPLLLQEAIYNSFYNNVWFSSERKFDIMQHKFYDKNKIPQITIYRTTRNNHSLLALPLGSFDLSVEDYITLSRNEFGTTRAIDTNSIFEYDVYTIMSDSKENKSVPTPSDLIIPKPYRKIVSEISSELNLKANVNTVQKVSNYFRKKYTYSLYQEKLNYNNLPLEIFFRSKHRGHCEFFASATVLLLRSAGIPARYVVGYSATEYDVDDELFIVRARDSHAWAQAYINKKWINVDNTPSIWYQAETANASFFEPLTDWFSKLNYKYNLWQRDNGLNNYTVYIIILVVVLLLILSFKYKGNRGWFIGYSSNKININGRKKNTLKSTYINVLLQQILQLGQQFGVSKQDHEPLLHWQKRLEQRTKNNINSSELRDILFLYYQLRFATDAATENNIREFKQKVSLWLNDCYPKLQKDLDENVEDDP